MTPAMAAGIERDYCTVGRFGGYAMRRTLDAFYHGLLLFLLIRSDLKRVQGTDLQHLSLPGTALTTMMISRQWNCYSTDHGQDVYSATSLILGFSFH